MLFSSTLFLAAFLPVVLLGQFLLPKAWRNAWLLLASLIFYAWGEVWLVSLMMLSIVVNYGFGVWAEREQKSGGGRAAVTSALIFNIGILLFFKYGDWLWISLGSTFSGHPVEPLGGLLVTSEWGKTALLTPGQHLRLPLGISFFTFQAMSYVIDVHRRDVGAEHNPINFALYKSLFPQLIAGPIVRYRDVHDQVTSRSITLSGFAYGVRRFVIGLGKKMLIANIAAQAADAIFAIPNAQLPTSVAWLGIVAYTVQIYFDFSGYSDMAIGLGHMLGFKFIENFNYPYVARSITDFWRRWHISLSSWFRDYLYIPLGGSRSGPSRTYFNLVLVFALCGLWHGASLSFLVWGLFHGAFLVIERVGLQRLLDRSPVLLRHVYVILVVMIGWVFFRAESLEAALAYLRTMFGLAGATPAAHHLALYLDTPLRLALVAALIGATPIVPALVERVEKAAAREESASTIAARTVGSLALIAVFLVSCLVMAAGTYNPFIYFRF